MAAILWLIWLVLAWMTGTWKDQTDAGRTQLVLWAAVSQIVFWLGLVCAAWGVGVTVLRHVVRPEGDG